MFAALAHGVACNGLPSNATSWMGNAVFETNQEKVSNWLMSSRRPVSRRKPYGKKTCKNMPLYFGNGVRCNDKQTLRATQKKWISLHILFLFGILMKNQHQTTQNTKSNFSVQKDEDKGRNMKTEREIRRQRGKYEDGERNTKTGRKIQIQRQKYEHWEKNTKTETEIRRLREKYEDRQRNTKTETEIRICLCSSELDKYT